MAEIEWTQAHVDALQKAIASGVLTVTYDGPPRRSITYQSIDAMLKVLALANRQVSSAPSHRLMKWRRGFRE